MQMEKAEAGYRLGIDVGGTFTDVVLVSEESGQTLVAKVPSTPADPSLACFDGLEKALSRHGLDVEQIRFFVHGTTVATNAIIEGKAGLAGLLTTEGFRDVLEIAFQTRPSLYDVFYDKPVPLVARSRCLGVVERIGADGEIIVPLDEDSVRSAAKKLKASGVKAIAIAFLHSYRNADHEQRAAEIIKQECGEIPVVMSSKVCPEFREYPRTSTTVVNAVLLPRVGPYVENLGQGFGERGMHRRVHLMTSSGGIVTGDVAKEYPVRLIESGPAAGVIGAAFVAGLAGHRNVIALDIGGTTAKGAIITNGEPEIVDEFEVGAQAVASVTANRGQGYPVRTAAVSLIEIGAGGGSIASIDPGGGLAVGPESAGADPGPVCYRQGGDKPTLTDANLVLGRINSEYFLGGEQSLDVEGARSAIQSQLASPMGISIEEAAYAVIEIANAKMISALHFISVRQGKDPREHVLTVSGGAGPMQAVSIADGLNIERILIPPTPGLNSTVGLLSADLKHEVVRTYLKASDIVSDEELRAAFQQMREELEATLLAEGVDPHDIISRSMVEVCYAGQSFALKIDADPIYDEGLLGRISGRFHEAHKEVYGFSDTSEAIRFINLRQVLIGQVRRPRLKELSEAKDPVSRAIKASRRVHFGPGHKWLDASIYDRGKLLSGDLIEGPAIFEQMDTTTVLPPEFTASVDRLGNLIIESRKREGQG